MIIANAFSLNMLPELQFGGCTIFVDECTAEEIIKTAESRVIESAIGHAPTAAVFSSILGLNLPANRTTVKLEIGQPIFVGQFVGPRLPEGSTSLPEGATIRWYTVVVQED